MPRKRHPRLRQGSTGVDNRPLDRLDADLQDEIRFYLEERAKEFMEEGRDADAAWRAALEAFGDIERIEADIGRTAKTRGSRGRGWEMTSSILRDLRYALRTLAAKPGFTVVALATLALGIGANTAMFSVVHATLFRAPPVDEPDELVAVFTTSRRGFPRSSTSYPDFLDYRDRSTRLADLAGSSGLPASLGNDDEGAESVAVWTVTGNYFPLLGVPPSYGRMLQPQDDVLGGGALVAVLRHDFWEDRFGADPAVVGQTIRLNRIAFEVVGVAPPDFRGMSLGSGPQIWIPMQSRPALSTGPVTPIWDQRGNRWMEMSIGRLAPSGAQSAVVIRAGTPRRDEEQIALGIRRDGRPRVRGPELHRLTVRERVANTDKGLPCPPRRSGMCIEASNDPGRLVCVLSVQDRGPHDDQVADHGGRRGVLELGPTALDPGNTDAEVHPPAAGEVRAGHTRRSVQREQARIVRGKEDPSGTLLAGGAGLVGPDRQAARSHHAMVLVRSIDLRIEGPKLVSRLGVEGDRSAERGHYVEDTVDHEGGGLERGPGESVLVRLHVAGPIRPQATSRYSTLSAEMSERTE